jgi:hypothetical protein
MLLDQVHNGGMTSFQEEVAIKGAIFCANGIANRRKDSQIQA